MKKSIFLNVIYKTILNIFNIILPIVVNSYVIGLLLEELFDAYNTANTQVIFFVTLGTFGIYHFGIREISKIREDKQKTEALFSSLVTLGVISNLVVLAVYLGYTVLFVGTHQFLYILLSLQIVANIFLVEWFNEAAENYGFITIKTIIVRLLYSAAIFIFLRKPTDIYIYAFLVVFAAFLNNAASFVYITRRIKFRMKKVTLKPYFKPVLIMFLTNNIGILFTMFDRLALGWFGAGDFAVTIYQIPEYITNTIITLMNSVVMVSMARLNQYVGQNKMEEYTGLLKRSSNMFMMAITPCALGLVAVANEVISIYTHGKYMDSAAVLQIFGVRTFFYALYTIFSCQIIYVFKKEKQLFKFLLAGGTANVIINFTLWGLGIFTPFMAILTTTIIEIIMTSSVYAYIRKRMKVEITFINKNTIKYYIAGLLFLPISWGVRLLGMGNVMTLAVTVGACAVLYAGTLLFARDEYALDIVHRLLGKLRPRKR